MGMSEYRDNNINYTVKILRNSIIATFDLVLSRLLQLDEPFRENKEMRVETFI